MSEQRLSVERAIAADPADIFAVLRSPPGHVAIDASGMLMAASGDPVTAVGDRFQVRMDRESLHDQPLGEYTVEVVIARFEPDRAIAWSIDGIAVPPIGHVYGYELAPIEGGTMVTSYYDWSDVHPAYRAAVDDIFPVISETNLRATLGILARVVAPGRGRPGAPSTAKGAIGAPAAPDGG
ncbi:MAG TPA: SRPBCC family protein [Ilumatobacteraceae bacterium]|nr:SRPBCC family protein [Ilumatobacteraceae bacterium]